jgi:hypothetical protein
MSEDAAFDAKVDRSGVVLTLRPAYGEALSASTRASHV